MSLLQYKQFKASNIVSLKVSWANIVKKESTSLPVFKVQYKAVLIKQQVPITKRIKKSMEHNSEPGSKSSHPCQLIFDKVLKSCIGGNCSAFSINSPEKTDDRIQRPLTHTNY